MPDVSIPGGGKVDRKKLLIGVAIGVGGLVIWLVIRRRNAAAQAPGTAGTDTGTAAAGADPNLDPLTGFDYGTAADQGALSGLYGGGGGITGSGGGIITIAPPPPAPTQSEAQWISQASSDLSRYGGVGRAAAAEALTEWIAGQQITAQQAQYVREALALDGNPPNGAPPVREKHSGTADRDVTVPHVTGEHLAAAGEKVRDAGLRPEHHGDRHRDIIRAQHPQSGRVAERGSVVELIT